MGDVDGDTVTRNMGEELHNEISFGYVGFFVFFCFFFNVLAKHWKCPEAFESTGLQFRREVGVRHILNEGVENNTNRNACRVHVGR